MSADAITEGPWQSQHDFDMEGVCRIIGAIDGPDDGRFHYKVICEVDPDGSLDTKEQYANARLIAAAPDLADLAANVAGHDERALEMADARTLRATIREYREQARAALSKARGEQ